MERNVEEDLKLIEIAKIDATVQTEEIAEHYLLKSQEHRDMLRKVTAALDDVSEKFNCGVYDDLIKLSRNLINNSI